MGSDPQYYQTRHDYRYKKDIQITNENYSKYSETLIGMRLAITCCIEYLC